MGRAAAAVEAVLVVAELRVAMVTEVRAVAPAAAALLGAATMPQVSGGPHGEAERRRPSTRRSAVRMSSLLLLQEQLARAIGV